MRHGRTDAEAMPPTASPPVSAACGALPARPSAAARPSAPATSWRDRRPAEGSDARRNRARLHQLKPRETPGRNGDGGAKKGDAGPCSGTDEGSDRSEGKPAYAACDQRSLSSMRDTDGDIMGGTPDFPSLIFVYFQSLRPLKKWWRAIQDRTANTYVIEVST